MEKFVAAAEPQYSELPYHEWGHAQAVMVAANALCSRMERRGTRLNCRPLIVAAAWHDVRFGGEYAERGYQSEEAYAAHLATDYLRKQKADENDIKIVNESILATEMNTPNRSLYGRALHHSDIENLGGPYEHFLTATTNIWREEAVLGAPITWQQHQERTKKFVEFSIAEAQRELPSLGEHIRTRGSFDTVAAANLELLLTEPAPEL